jgi:hypothetical protein
MIRKGTPLFVKPYYAYKIDDEDDNGKLYTCTVFRQKIENPSRNEIVVHATSLPMSYEDAEDWGEHLVKALSK